MTTLYFVRHGESEANAAHRFSGRSDSPLTERGRAQARAAARRLSAYDVTAVVSSPLLRARQTAERLMENWKAPLPQLLLCDALAPDNGKMRKVNKFLLKQMGNAVALVGHFPQFP